MTSQSTCGLAEKPRKLLKAMRAQNTTLSVIIYGQTGISEAVGDFLFRCSQYLQSPLRCDRNVPYRNPQSLSCNENNTSMTYQLQSQLPPTQVETLGQGADPSTALETDDSLPETEAPVEVKTLLYK